MSPSMTGHGNTQAVPIASRCRALFPATTAAAANLGHHGLGVNTTCAHAVSHNEKCIEQVAARRVAEVEASPLHDCQMSTMHFAS